MDKKTKENAGVILDELEIEELEEVIAAGAVLSD